MEALLGVVMSDNPRNKDCEYVMDNWLRMDIHLSVSRDIYAIIDSFFYAGDEWSAWGKNLQLLESDYNNNSIIINAGSNITDEERKINHRSKGSAFGLKVVYPTNEYYWKIRVSDEYQYTFAIGFVKEDNGIIDGHGWYIKNKHSVGIYSDKQIWTNSVLLCNDGIQFANRDLINLCLDYNKKGVYVQRLEYIDNNDDENDSKIITDKEITRNYIIHDAKRVFGGIDVNSNYRLACYLRIENQNVEIIKFQTLPFKEWQIEICDNDRSDKEEDKPVIIMYQ